MQTSSPNRILSYISCFRSAIYILLTITSSPLAFSQSPGEWPIEKLKNDVPNHRVLDDSKPVHSIFYEGEVINGKSTEVFAFYASPTTLGRKEEKPYPGIVLIHGGGGTAFANWTQLWAERGYAAIAMDLSGHQPPEPSFNKYGYVEGAYHWHDKSERTKLKNGSLQGNPQDKFDSIHTPTTEDDWLYHAVANVMRAHTLLRSFEEVDSDRTAVTGISWGGYTTCLVASLDDRFKAAVPIYGCGFIWNSDSVQRPFIDALADSRQKWIDAYSPSSHLKNCDIPTLWVNGTHDENYPIDAFIKSSKLITGSRSYRIELNMPHNHIDSWILPEIQIFIDSILRDGQPMPQISSVQACPKEQIIVYWESPLSIKKATLYYTTDEGLRTERKWEFRPMQLEKDHAITEKLPNEANTWFINITDEHGIMVSSEVFFSSLQPLL